MRKFFFGLFVLCCAVISAQDRPVLKIDFNEPSRLNMDEVLEPGYTPWGFAKDCFRDELKTNGITFIVSSANNMRAGWKKEFVQAAVKNSRLIGDGISFDPKDLDGSFLLTIKGLPVGRHNIKTYHNTWQDSTITAGWPIFVYCNDSLVGKVQRTFRETSAGKAAFAGTYFEILQPGDSAVLRFETLRDSFPADSAYKTKYDVTPLLNGFELNTADVRVYWPFANNLNGADSVAIRAAATAEVTDKTYPASFLFTTGVSKGSNLNWNDAQEVFSENDSTDGIRMCKLKTTALTSDSDEDALVFSLKPELGSSFYPKLLNISLAFNDQSADQSFIIELNNGTKSYTLDTVYALSAARSRLDLQYDLFTLKQLAPSSEIWQLSLRLRSNKAETKVFVGQISISGDGTDPDSSVYFAQTEVFPQGSGSVDPASCYFVKGQTVAFLAQATDQYKLKHWEVDGEVVSTENPLVRNDFWGDTTLRAVFAKKDNYNFTCSVEGGEANKVRIEPLSEIQFNGSYLYEDADRITLTAFPSDSMYFALWKDSLGNVVSRTNPYSFIIHENTHLVAVFTDEEVLPLRAFPTAQGYGQYATGGRGGYVVEVTNLSTDPTVPGSIMWAIRQHSGKPITVVFRVSGIIESDNRYISLDRSNVTYAGQTAPGDGICFKKAKVKLNGTNIIVRNLRFRVGDELGLSLSAIGVENCKRVIIDHCSFSWSTEENITMYDNDSTTMQYCIVSEPLYNSNNYKGARAYGSQWGGEYATYHHNLLAHCVSRAPRFNGSSNNDLYGFVDFRNNVMYNCGGSYGGEIRNGGLACFTQMINNYYKTGPISGNSFVNPSSPYGKWYIEGNYMENNSEANANNWKAVSGGNHENELRSYTLYDEFPILTETAQEAYQSVLAGAGAIYPKRDTIDVRIIKEAKGDLSPTIVATHGSPGIIDTPAEAGGWPLYQSPSAPSDSDHDGMPDDWEIANNLNPNNPEDRNKITQSGYTCLEVYLNELCNEKIQLTFPDAAKQTPYLNTHCYLNPSSGILYVQSETIIHTAFLYDLNGRMIKSFHAPEITEWNLLGLNPGWYLLELRSDTFTYKTKLTVY